MPQSAIVPKLQSFMSLGADERARVERLCAERRSLPAGVELLEAGRRYATAFVIHEGWALRHRSLPDGRRQVINFLLPGDAFGLGSVVLSRPDHTVSAITPVTVSPIETDILLTLLREDPRLGAAFLWSAAQEEAVLREHLVSIGRRSAFERMAHLLLELWHRLQLVGRAGPDRFALPLSQPLLADALGLSTVHANRTLRRLQREGLIRLQQRQITLLKIETLTRIADFSRAWLHVPADAAGAAPAAAS